LFCAGHKVGSHTPAQLQQFVAKHYTTGRTAVVGVGVSHAALTKVINRALYSFQSMGVYFPKKSIEYFRSFAFGLNLCYLFFWFFLLNVFVKSSILFKHD